MQNNNKQYNLVDITKWVMACLVIILHAGVYKADVDSGLFYVERILLRLPVPYFFVSSGFFLARNINNCKSERAVNACLNKYLNRLLVKFLFFEGLYVVFELLKSFIKDGSSTEVVYILKKAILHPYGALWYVIACLIGVLLIKVIFNCFHVDNLSKGNALVTACGLGGGT